MDLLSNWVFWIIIAAIVFVLALIGYLTDSIKKSKKYDKNDDEVKPQPVEPKVERTEEPTESVVNDDWTTMPEVKVDTIDEKPTVTPVMPTVNATVDTPVSSGESLSATSSSVNVSSEPSTVQTDSTPNDINVDSSNNTETLVSNSDTSASQQTSESKQDATVETLDVSDNNDKDTNIWN